MATCLVAVLLPAGLWKLHDIAARLWLRLQATIPALRSEYVQVLVFVVVPLVLLLTILLVDLKVGRRLSEAGGEFIVRPSLAVRCAYALGIVLLTAGLVLNRQPHWVTLTADFLAILELLRTFPRRFILAPDGIRWRNVTGQVLVPWEHILYFAEQRSIFGVEYKLTGSAGETLVISPLVFPGWKQIIRRISMSLGQRHLQPGSVAPRTTLETLHRLLLPACLLMIFFDGKIPGFN